VAEHVVRYLTRYLTGGPISDHRIIQADRQNVTFAARAGVVTGGERVQVPVTLSTQEFTRRWSEHIQPDQLTKVRYFGGWSNSQVSDYQACCRELLGGRDSVTAAEEHAEVSIDSQPEIHCEHCGSERLVLLSVEPKPSWRELLGYRSQATPWWYDQQREQSDRRLWDTLMGAGYSDWYEESRVESAEERPAEPPQPIQLALPGVDWQSCRTSSYLLDSY
jgi:DNA-directed RNA polymerase subunit RPC12/RpoP